MYMAGDTSGVSWVYRGGRVQRAQGVLPLRPFACSVVAAQANVAAIPFPGAHALVASSRRISCEAVDSSVSAMTIFIDGLHLCCTALRKCPDFTCHYVNTRHTHTHARAHLYARVQ